MRTIDHRNADPSIVKFSLWKGRPVDSLTREELLAVIDYCGRDIQRLRIDRDRWQRSGDPLAYLIDAE